MSTDEQVLEELKEIRKLLTPPEPSPPPQGFISEFTSFLSKYKVLGLAVAFILGLYLGALVQAMVGDLIMPLITIFIPDVAWQDIVFGPFMVGHFIGELITFIIIAFVVFLLVKFATRIGIE
ncbi:MAG: large conductance mechanosensitive channel protein MscL [Candidatus Thorarchaeota archaeon]|jgi:large conductance mechanosensitive channel